MNDFDNDVDLAVRAMKDLVEGPARAASEVIGLAFDDAGLRIEQSLARAARSGELDFRRMAENILSDMAKIAAEIAILRLSASAPGGMPDDALVSPQVPPHAPVMASSGALAVSLASAAMRGGRYI